MEQTRFRSYDNKENSYQDSNYLDSPKIPFSSHDIHKHKHSKEEDQPRMLKGIIKKYGHKEGKETSDRKQNVCTRSLAAQPELTFKPEISDLPRDLYGSPHGKLDISKEEQWDRLLKSKKEDIQARERLKQEKESKELENCTFRPEITKEYKLTSAKHTQNRDVPINERLYHEGIEKLKSKDVLKREAADQEQYTFKPDVAESIAVLKGEKADTKPLHQRLHDILKKKQEFIHNLRAEAESGNPDLTFKPRLNEYTEIIANNKKEIPDVTDRLMKDAAEKAQRIMNKAEEYEKQIHSVCTFQPSINPASVDEILAKNEIYTTQKDIVTRQYLLADLQKERLEKKKQKILAEENITFTPKVNKISNFLVEADTNRVNETFDDKFDRLSKKDAQKREIFQEQMKKAYYDQFSFKPEINQISKKLGRRNSLDTLAYNREGQEHLRLLREKSIDNMLVDCTFKPETNNTKKKFESVQPHYKKEGQIMETIKVENKKKEIKLDLQKKINEYDVMRECTFKPKTNGNVPEEELKPQLNQKVNGLERFMQMRDLNKKIKEEKKKREEEVFGYDKKYNSTKHEGFTVPKPFALSKNQKTSIRDQRVAQELKEKMTREYTFKPQTNEGKNREIINRMISESYE